MKRYGYWYGNPGRRKMLMLFHNAFQRNIWAMCERDLGFRVRCFDRKPPPVHGYQGA